MTEDMDCTADGTDRGPAITLQNAIADISGLAEDLREIAQLFDSALPEGASARTTSDAMTPRLYFASLLDLLRTRGRQFSAELSGRPEWDIMLQLMIARIDGREPKLSELSRNVASPPQATRWRAEKLIEAGLAERFENVANPNDFCISLSGAAALRLAELYRARMRG